MLKTIKSIISKIISYWKLRKLSKQYNELVKYQKILEENPRPNLDFKTAIELGFITEEFSK